MHDYTDKIEESLITSQQENGFKSWLEQREQGNPLEFWEFYQMWCREKGYFFDIQSSQDDEA